MPSAVPTTTSAVPTTTNNAPLSLVVVAVPVAVFTLLVTGKKKVLIFCSYQTNLWSLIFHCTIFLPPTVTVVTAVIIICLKTTAKKGKKF